jgi:hypothetical protein
MAHPEGFIPPTHCLEATQHKTLSASAGVANKEARRLFRPRIGLKMDRVSKMSTRPRRRRTPALGADRLTPTAPSAALTFLCFWQSGESAFRSRLTQCYEDFEFWHSFDIGDAPALPTRLERALAELRTIRMVEVVVRRVRAGFVEKCLYLPRLIWGYLNDGLSFT